MDAAINIQHQDNDKKKAKRFAFWFHTILLAAIAFPFLTQTESEAPKYEKVIEIDFSKDFKAASAMSSTKKAAPTPTKKAVEKPKPVEKTKPVKKPKPKPVKTAPRKPVLKTPSPKAPVIKEAPVIKPTPTPAPEKIEAPTEEVFEEIEEVAEPASSSTTKETAPTGKASDKGEGTKGSSDKGAAKMDGKADKGDSGLDFSGDALFTRRVIYRADIKQLTQVEGKIVVNLCVNQQGRVIYTDFNKAESTINDMDLVRKAMKATQNYRFEKDYSAPRKQCGKLSFIFEIEEE